MTKKLIDPSAYSYVFKVVFPNRSLRHIKMSAINTLEMLHEVILKDTKFSDIWHLHSFFMDKKAWTPKSEIPCVDDTDTRGGGNRRPD